MDGVEFRPMDHSDEAYVLSTWARSHRDHARRTHRTPAKLDEYRAGVMLPAVNLAGVTVACSSEHRGTLLGWICATPRVLHYVYVRDALRCQGLAREMIAAAMGGYGERIACASKWPFRSQRFVFDAARRVA